MSNVRTLRRPVPRAPVDELALTKPELARALGVTTRLIEKRRAADPANFPVHPWGRRLVRYYVSEVRAYLDAERGAA